jgi:CheY-like chemotaxis protein
LFTQGDFAKERKLGGLGVGLSLVKRLVDLHGGSISVDSAGANKGARFTVRLPLTSESAYRAEVSKLQPGADNVPHRRILLVDDDLDAVESMRLLLEISGHEVYGVYDGASAIEAAPRLAPDMALIDIGLPGVGGHEVAKQIRRDRNGDKIVLAALTGYGTDEDRKQSRGPQPVIQVWIGNCWLADFDGRTSDGADGDQQSKTHSPKYLVGTQQ